MNDTISSLLGPVAAMAAVRPGLKARQVTTHTHEPMRIGSHVSFRDVGHWDFKPIPAQGSWEFPPMEGPGCVTALWITVAGRLSEALRRKRVPAHKYLWINIYYDGAQTPAVSAPIGHFFGNGTTKYVSFSSKFVGMTSGGYYSYLPMPFQRSCRVVMENRHPKREIQLFYGAITYLQAPELPADAGYLHAQYREREFRDSKDMSGSMIPNDPHLILEENAGPGRFAGMTLAFYPTHPIKSRYKKPFIIFPYLEGNLKVFVDGEVGDQGPAMIAKPPGSPPGPQSLECTGVEDYFLSGWYYISGPFAALYHGCPVRSLLSGVVSQYRFHEADPYPWQDRIRMTMTHGEFDNVDCRMESLAFYYKKVLVDEKNNG
jgi:hypothetical protein